MFSLAKLFEAFRRLTDSVHKTADLVDRANEEIGKRLSIGSSMDSGLPESEVVINQHSSEPDVKRITRRSARI